LKSRPLRGLNFSPQLPTQESLHAVTGKARHRGDCDQRLPVDRKIPPHERNGP
jgi:hypothetical protein